MTLKKQNDFCGLQDLAIRNIGTIESADLELSGGLNVLTGETGAGKTMVLSALGLVLGGKADADRVRTGTDRLTTTALFKVNPEVKAYLRNLDVEVPDNELLLARSVTAEGKSRIALAGSPSTNAQVGELSEKLIEIHAQSSSQRLMKSDYIREILDHFDTAAHEAIEKYLSVYGDLLTTEREIKALSSDLKTREKELAELQEFAKKFKEISPESGEIESIESELSRLENVDALARAGYAALEVLAGEEYSIAQSLSASQRELARVKAFDHRLELLVDALGSKGAELLEHIAELERYVSSLDADPSKLDEIQNRKAQLNALVKRFGVGSDRIEAYEELVSRGAGIDERISNLIGGDSRLEELKERQAALIKKVGLAGSQLSDVRRKNADKLSSHITAELSSLSMPHARIEFVVAPRDASSRNSFDHFGCDEISLGFASHEGASLLPIGKAASGGELSRVMLAIEVVTAQIQPVATYIFDEVDAGVGGQAAMEVGKRLWKLSQNAQVIVVTHLAQVAVWADNHLVVEKNEDGSISSSGVKAVEAGERAREIARMLSGQSESESAQVHALELLQIVQKERDLLIG